MITSFVKFDFFKNPGWHMSGFPSLFPPPTKQNTRKMNRTRLKRQIRKRTEGNGDMRRKKKKATKKRGIIVQSVFIKCSEICNYYIRIFPPRLQNFSSNMQQIMVFQKVLLVKKIRIYLTYGILTVTKSVHFIFKTYEFWSP
jgi:hypothetical protein